MNSDQDQSEGGEGTVAFNESRQKPTPELKAARTLEPDARYELMTQPEYGHDCSMTPIQPEAGYAIVPKGEVIQKGDKPWDVFAGWIKSDGYHARNELQARSAGRWTCWERPVTGAGSAG
jgi:hypothetical protein